MIGGEFESVEESTISNRIRQLHSGESIIVGQNNRGAEVINPCESDDWIAGPRGSQFRTRKGIRFQMDCRSTLNGDK